MASGDIVHCPVCAQLVAVTKRGKVWSHGADGQKNRGALFCAGSKRSVTPDQIVGTRGGSVWQRLKDASCTGTELKLSPGDLKELMQHGSICDEVEEQLHYETMAKDLRATEVV